MTTRTRPTNSGLGRVAFCIFLVIGSACESPPKVVPSGDVPSAPEIARSTAALLEQLAAYDYAVAGSLAGQTTRVVSSARWATVARGILPKLADVISSSLSATSNAAGPVRDSVVSLADTLTDLSKDANAYADGADPALLAKTVGDVNLSWDRVQALALKLPLDTELQKTVTRGRSFSVTPTSSSQFALQAGPYATAADADAAAKKIGTVISTTAVAPFIVRVATYPSRAQADAALAALKPKGIDVATVVEEHTYTFARGGAVPDVELWREPARVINGPAASRRLAMSPDGKWIAMGSDDGTLGIFDAATGGLVALPKFQSGLSALLFSGDSAWLFAGGASATVLFVPSGASALGTAQLLRFPSAITQTAFVNVPGARAFVAVSKSPSGVAGSGGGLIGARAPDGAVIGDPFPIVTPAAGGFIAVTDRAELFVATTSAGKTDVEVLRVGTDHAIRGVISVPGVAEDLAMDPTGDRGAVVTDQGTYRFAPHDANPTATLQKVGPPVRDVSFGTDGTFYRLDKDKAIATGPDGAQRWQVPLTDGRKLVSGLRTVVWDGADIVWAIAADGTADALGTDGQVQDLTISADGKRAGVVLDGKRALIFVLQ